MKYALIHSTIALLVSLFTAQLASAAEIHADITGVKNNQGHVQCALFKSEKGFPSETTDALQVVGQLASTTEPITCDFRDLAAGTYAVAVLHDENDDRVANKNLLGIPTESYGVSNNHTHAMSAPTFEESKVTLDANARLNLSIQLK